MVSVTDIPTSVSTEEARELKQHGAQIIDVRTPAEFESVHIPGSYNVPLDLLAEHREELTRSVDKPVVLVCGSGIRASQADSSLRQAGLESITVLDGGINAWEQRGGEVVRGVQKWSLERQVRLVAGSLVLAGALGGLLLWRPLTFISLFVGGGLTFAGITNTCGMANLLSKLPYNQGQTCDVQQVIREIAADSNAK
jgi:rhodanese-related sulfurtransferase